MSGEDFGAFVEVEHERLGREGIFLLGAREAIDRHIAEIDRILKIEPNPIAQEVLKRYQGFMVKDRDGISVALTQTALKDKAGQLTKLRDARND